MSERTQQDEAVDEVFEQLVDDELEAFVFASYTGDLPGSAMSYSPADDGRLDLLNGPPCRIPRMELMGRLVHDLSIFFDRPPEKVAEVAAHVARDHCGWSEDRRQRVVDSPEEWGGE